MFGNSGRSNRCRHKWYLASDLLNDLAPPTSSMVSRLRPPPQGMHTSVWQLQSLLAVAAIKGFVPTAPSMVSCLRLPPQRVYTNVRQLQSL